MGQEKKTVRSHQTSVVVSLDYRATSGAVRIGDSATMSVFNDGTIEFPANYPGQKAQKGHITKSELAELMSFIVTKHRFLKLDLNQLARDIAIAQRPISSSSDAKVVMTVRFEGTTRKATLPVQKLDLDNRDLQHLNAIKKKLDQVRIMLQLGGRKELETWLKEVNSLLNTKYPKARPLQFDDLYSGGVRADGTQFVSFLRIAAPKGKPSTTTMVNVYETLDGSNRVSVTHRIEKK